MCMYFYNDLYWCSADFNQLLVHLGFLHKHSLSVTVSSAMLNGIAFFWAPWPLNFQGLYSLGKLRYIFAGIKKNLKKPHTQKRLFTVSPLHKFTNYWIRNLCTLWALERIQKEKKSHHKGAWEDLESLRAWQRELLWQEVDGLCCRRRVTA